jgi:hypothetical protein
VCGGAAARRLACTPPSAAFLGSGSLQLRLQSLAGKAAARHARSQQAASPAPLADPSPPANPKVCVRLKESLHSVFTGHPACKLTAWFPTSTQDIIRKAPDPVKMAYATLNVRQVELQRLMIVMTATACLCWGALFLSTVLPAEAAQVLHTAVAPVQAAFCAGAPMDWVMILIGYFVYWVISDYLIAKRAFAVALKLWM